MTQSAPPQSQGDPPPVPPTRPGSDECCHSGCDPCIFDLFAAEEDRYREALRIWQARRKAQEPGCDPCQPLPE